MLFVRNHDLQHVLRKRRLIDVSYSCGATCYANVVFLESSWITTVCGECSNQLWGTSVRRALLITGLPAVTSWKKLAGGFQTNQNLFSIFLSLLIYPSLKIILLLSSFGSRQLPYLRQLSLALDGQSNAEIAFVVRRNQRTHLSCDLSSTIAVAKNAPRNVSFAQGVNCLLSARYQWRIFQNQCVCSFQWHKLVLFIQQIFHKSVRWQRSLDLHLCTEMHLPDGCFSYWDHRKENFF